MGMLANRAASGNKKQIQRDRFILGASECYFEAAQYLSGQLSVEKVVSLFNNEAMSVGETEGKSLKVLFTTPTGEVKFVGFVTAGDASVELDVDDAEAILSHARQEGAIVKAIDAKALVDLF